MKRKRTLSLIITPRPPQSPSLNDAMALARNATDGGSLGTGQAAVAADRHLHSLVELYLERLGYPVTDLCAQIQDAASSAPPVEALEGFAAPVHRGKIKTTIGASTMIVEGSEAENEVAIAPTLDNLNHLREDDHWGEGHPFGQHRRRGPGDGQAGLSARADVGASSFTRASAAAAAMTRLIREQCRRWWTARTSPTSRAPRMIRLSGCARKAGRECGQGRGRVDVVVQGRPGLRRDHVQADSQIFGDDGEHDYAAVKALPDVERLDLLRCGTGEAGRSKAARGDRGCGGRIGLAVDDDVCGQAPQGRHRAQGKASRSERGAEGVRRAKAEAAEAARKAALGGRGGGQG